MNITSTKHSLLRLWLESFAVINRCTGKLLWIIGISILLFILATVILVLTMGTSGAMAVLLAGRTGQIAGIGGILVYFLFTLGSNIYGILFFTVCCRLVAQEALEERQPLAETFSSSVFPTLYQIAVGFLLAIPMILIGIIAAIIARVSPVLVVLLLLAIFFVVGPRLCYSFIAIAVAGKGPIEGLIHSWKMTAGKNYVDALLMILMCIGSVLLMYLCFAAIGYGLFIMIPLHFANSFNLAHPSLIWILLAILLGILAIFWYFVILAFPVLVFINRNATLFDARDLATEPTFIPLPELQLPDIHPNPEHMQQAQSTVSAPILTEKDLAEQATEPSVAPQTPPAQPTPAEKTQAPDVPALEGLEVSRSSINTSEHETDSLSEHLDKVYTPQKEDIVQYGEEDRMPTILFDDEMAKQLEENQTKFAPKAKEDNPDKKDEGPDSVKISKF